MNDVMMERLATYFVHFEVGTKKGITFEQFLELVTEGLWKMG